MAIQITRNELRFKKQRVNQSNVTYLDYRGIRTMDGYPFKCFIERKECISVA